jgi:hypothetical protein
MSDLQTTYYTLGIIFMSLMLLLMIIGVVAVLVIRAKIVAIHQQIDDRLAKLNEWTEKGEAVVGALKKAAHKAKR